MFTLSKTHLSACYIAKAQKHIIVRNCTAQLIVPKQIDKINYIQISLVYKNMYRHFRSFKVRSGRSKRLQLFTIFQSAFTG
jgi:hypothetical protein